VAFGAGAVFGGARIDLWNWLPGTVVAPHFGQYNLQAWRDAYPDCQFLGIPDDAMARIDGAEVTSLGPADLVTLPPWEATLAD
jgi:hypothetical protein